MSDVLGEVKHRQALQKGDWICHRKGGAAGRVIGVHVVNRRMMAKVKKLDGGYANMPVTDLRWLTEREQAIAMAELALLGEGGE